MRVLSLANMAISLAVNLLLFFYALHLAYPSAYHWIEDRLTEMGENVGVWVDGLMWADKWRAIYGDGDDRPDYSSSP